MKNYLLATLAILFLACVPARVSSQFFMGSLTTCPFGAPGADGCGTSPGIDIVPAFFSGFAQQSSQVYGNTTGTNCVRANCHPPWNVAGADYGVGPTVAPTNYISTWTPGAQGCTYYSSGFNANVAGVPQTATGAVIPSAIAANGWPNTQSGGVDYNTYINVLACAAPTTSINISNYIMADPSNNQCVVLFVYGNGGSAGVINVFNNTWKNTVQCAGYCTLSPTSNFCDTPLNNSGVVTGYITVADNNKAKLIVHNNSFDGQWDQTTGNCADPATNVVGFPSCAFSFAGNGPFVVAANGLFADFTFEYNYVRHSVRNVLSITFRNGNEGACNVGNFTPTQNLGAGWPYNCYNVNISYNYGEGLGKYVGFGHGEFMNWNYSPLIVADASGLASLAGNTLTSCVDTISPGSLIYDSGLVIFGGVETTTAGIATGSLVCNGDTTTSYTYAVTQPVTGPALSFTNESIRAYFGNIAFTAAYNTWLSPNTQSGGSQTAVFFSFNNTATYAVGNGMFELVDIHNSTVVANLVAGATTAAPATPYGATYTYHTDGGSPTNNLLVTGLASCANAPPVGAEVITGPYQIGPITLASCTGSSGNFTATYSQTGCASPEGTSPVLCPAEQYTLAPGAAVGPLAELFDFQIMGFGIVEFFHTTNINVTNISGNYIDTTGSGEANGQGIALEFGSSGKGMYCQSTITFSGNVDMLTGNAIGSASPLVEMANNNGC